MRTTVDIDAPLLRDLRRLQKKEGKSLGRLVSDLLVIALRQRREVSTETRPFVWIQTPGKLLVDLLDKDRA